MCFSNKHSVSECQSGWVCKAQCCSSKSHNLSLHFALKERENQGSSGSSSQDRALDVNAISASPGPSSSDSSSKAHDPVKEIYI